MNKTSNAESGTAVAGAARGSASWSHHKDCYLQSEGGTSGWNKAWNGENDYKSTRIIETHAETPEAARKLVARITDLLNTHGE